MSEALNFTTETASVPVVIDGKKYLLTELNGVERDQYQQDLGTRTIFEKGAVAGIKRYDAMKAFLVHLSLRDEKGSRVPVEVINGWPARISEALYNKASEISGLDKAAKEAAVAAKNA